MRQSIHTKPFLASAAINGLLFLLFLSIFYTRYGTTDDVEMQMVLAGKGVLQEPSAHLRWTHLFIGQVLSTLYTWLPSLPWYGWYLTLAHFLGMTAILYSILIIKASWYRVAFFAMCFLLGETALLQELQYTSATLVLEMGAVFLIFLAITQDEHLYKKRWYGAAFSMLIFGAMMRWDAFLLMVGLASPLLLYAIVQLKERQKQIFNLGFCIAIIATAWCVNKVHYLIENQDKGWAEFNEYKLSLVAHDILDYNKPQYQWNESSADDYFYRVGWEYEDLMLFKQWFFADSSVYNLRKFKAMQENFQNCPYPIEHLQERQWQFFIEFPMKDYVFYGFLLLALSFLFFHGNRNLFISLGASAFFVFALLAYLFVYKHLPTRVSYPMTFYLICLAALFVTYDKEIARKTKLISLFVVGLMALSNLKMVTNESSKTAFDKMNWWEALDSLHAKPNQLYIGAGDYYMQAVMTPYQSLGDSIFSNFNMLDFGHLANCPTHYEQLANFGIKNIHTQAPIDSNIYLVHRYDAPLLKWYENFVLRHYNLHINFEPIRKEKKVNLVVYRIVEEIREEKNSQGINLANMHEFGIKPKVPGVFEKDPTKPYSDRKELEVFIIN